MDDKKNTMVTSFIGLAFVVLGILLIVTLLNWINSSAIYQTALPLVLIIGGFSLFSAEDSKKRRTSLGLGMLTFGVVALLVRFNMISGEIVNAVLGLILLVSGTIMLTRLADKHATKKEIETK